MVEPVPQHDDREVAASNKASAPSEESRGLCAECGHDDDEHWDGFCEKCEMIENLEGRLHVPASPMHEFKPTTEASRGAE